MKNRKILIAAIMFSICVITFGISYSFFNYTKVTNTSNLVTGTISMKVENDETDITLTNVFPETQEKADLKTDNYIDFTVKGTNTYTKPIYYQIDVINGSIPTDHTEDDRIDASNVMLELTSLDTNEVLVLCNYNDLVNNKIYVNVINTTSTEVEHKYRLRMWIDENTLISDTDPNRTYCASDECDDTTLQVFSELFASVKVKVQGDLREKHLYNVMGTLPTDITDEKANITEIYFLNDTYDNISTRYTNATIKADVTNTDKTVGTTELQNLDDYGKVYAWIEGTSLYIATDGYTYLSTGSSLFSEFTNLTTIDLSNVKTNYVTDMSYMFSSCTNLTTIKVDTNWNIDSVTTSTDMFSGCSKLVGGNGTKFNSSYVDKTYAIVDTATYDTDGTTVLSGTPGYLILA